MTKSPSFQFYPKDWLSSLKVLMMTPAQEGAYIRLLCYCWDSGDCSIPDDDTQLAVMSRLAEGWFKGGSTAVRKCFVPHPTKPGFLTNERLYEEAQKQLAWKEKSREGGKRSAAQRTARQQELKGGSRVVQAQSNPPVQPNANSSTASASTDKRSGGTSYTPQFEEFWKLAPRTTCSKSEAYQSYQRAIKSGANHEDIIRGIQAYTDYLAKSGSPAAHATTWLNNGRWAVDYDAALASRSRVTPATPAQQPEHPPRRGAAAVGTAGKSRWQTESDRLVAKYQQQAAQRGGEGGAGGSVGEGMRPAEAVRQDGGGAGDAGGGV